MLGNCRRFLSISMHIGEGLLGPLFSRPQCGSQETIHPFLPTPSLRPYTCRSQSTSESTVLFSAVTIAVSMTVTPFPWPQVGLDSTFTEAHSPPRLVQSINPYDMSSEELQESSQWFASDWIPQNCFTSRYYKSSFPQRSLREGLVAMLLLLPHLNICARR